MKNWWTRYRNPQEKAELVSAVLLLTAVALAVILIYFNLL